MTDGPIETPGPEGTEQLSGPQGDITTPEGSNGHPAWQPILNALPDEALRNMVLPHLQEWDRGVQERFQSLHSEYEPWKPVIEQAEPELVQQALQLVAALEENPEFVYQRLAETYGFGTQQQGTPAPETPGQQTVEIEGQEFDANDPVIQRLAAMESTLGGLYQTIQQQQQQEQIEDQIEAYEAHMEGLKGRYPGPYDEQVIDSMVANGVDPEAAIQRYQASVKQHAQQLVAPNASAPSVMGGSAGGSGLPTQQLDPATLDTQGTKSLVAAIIEREMGKRP